MTNLVQTISNKDSFIIYYDADVFNQNVTLSAHLTLPEITNTSGPVQFSQTETVEWNTIYQENFGTSGSLDGQMTSNFFVNVAPGTTSIAYQDYDFAFLTSASYTSYGTSGTAGTNGVSANINVITDTVDLVSDLPFQDSGVLTLTGQILNYYQTVNNVPQYIVQKLSEIAVQIWALPTNTEMIGEDLVSINATLTYSLPASYDPGNAYTYLWRLRPIASGDTAVSNSRADIVGYVSTPDNTRSVVLHFKRNGFVTLEVVIFGSTGCPRIIRKQISVELPLTKMLIIRNRLV